MARTHEEFVNELKSINPTIKVLGKYTRAIDPVEVECLNCHRIWSPKAYSLLQKKGCAHCGALIGSLNNKGKTRRKKVMELRRKQIKNILAFLMLLRLHLLTS